MKLPDRFRHNTNKTVIIGEGAVEEKITEILDVKYSKVSTTISELPADTTIGNIDYDKVPEDP